MADDVDFPSILCADDDIEVLEQLKEHFTLKGFIVLTATSGVEACLQVKRWAPRAVIMDLSIPELGGIDALGHIRAIDPMLPVILTSATGDPAAMVADAGVGVAGTFAKPLDLEGISQALARAGVTPPAELATESASVVPVPRARVLVVDDEDEFRKALVEYLSSKGLDVCGARSGDEAVERSREFAPHIVLLDVMLGGTGAQAALREIKGVAPQACVIMVTALPDVDAARRALAGGASDYITKPFPFSYLDAVLGVYLPQDLTPSRV